MAILTGRYGQVLYDPLGATATVPIVSLNAWKLSTKTDTGMVRHIIDGITLGALD